MTKLGANYNETEWRAIADWVSKTTDVLVTNTRRVMSLNEAP
jgi:hypothetical protein